MLEGVIIVLQLFFFTNLFAIPLGVGIALIQISNNKVLKLITDFYIWLLRGTPLLLQLMFFYYVLPMLSESLVFEKMPLAIMAFSLNYAAYYAEIFRAGLQSIDKGQFEAAKVLGFSKVQMYKRIILPQVTKKVIPSVFNELITLVKDTSLVYVLAMNDLLRIATAASNREVSLMPYLYVALIYLAMTAFLTQFMKIVEKKYSYYS